MRHIVEQLVLSGASLGLGGESRFYIDDRRLQRNLGKVMKEPAMTAAVLNGVLVDHRVVESLSKVDEVARAIVLQVEAKLGRKLGRERAQKLVAHYARIRTTRLQGIQVERSKFKPEPAQSLATQL